MERKIKLIKLFAGLLVAIGAAVVISNSVIAMWNDIERSELEKERQITVLNTCTGDVIYQDTGNFKASTSGGWFSTEKLEISKMQADGSFTKTVVNLGENITYYIDDITETAD